MSMPAVFVPPLGLVKVEPQQGWSNGVPARRVGWMCQCGERLHPAGGGATCAVCGASYQESNGALRQIKPSRVRAS